MWLWIREAGRKEQLGTPSFIKTSLRLLPLLALIPAQTLANAQVKVYAEMICGTNLKIAETEDPEIKKRCMSGLIKLGKKALRVSGSSIQRCKAEDDFFSCINGHTSDASRLARTAREHSVEIRSISLTPHHLNSPRLEDLGQTIKHVLGPRSIIWSNNSKTSDVKVETYMGTTTSQEDLS